MTTETTQYLSFKLNEETFAIDIAKVREVLDFTTVTKVPQTPHYMVGVINLRGSVVPVIDMRQKFSMGVIESTVDTCIIINEVFIDEESIIIGSLVDSVDEVFDLRPEDIEASPKIGTQLDTRFLKGMGKKDDTFILILDIDLVFTLDELTMAQNMKDDLLSEAADREEVAAG